MCKKDLCSHCETGKYTHKLDKGFGECPYIYCRDGNKCGMYKKLSEPKNVISIAGLVRRLKNTFSKKSR